MTLHKFLRTQQAASSSADDSCPSKSFAIMNALALEWPELTTKLSEEAKLPSVRESLKNLEPDSTPELREHVFDLTAEMSRILETQLGFFQFAAVEPLAALESARLERILQPQELLDIRRMLELALQAKAFAEGREASSRRSEYPLVSDLLEGFDPQPKLYQKLARSIGDEAEVLSAASDELRKAREEIAQAERKLIVELERLLKVPDIKDALQDPIWMRREGRFVLPVRTDRKSAITGVTVGVSQSGSTLFIEPSQLAHVQSTLDAARRDEQIAISRVLAELSQQCSANYLALESCLATLEAIDELVARARFVKRLGAVRPKLHSNFSLPRFSLKAARHPLFVLENKSCIANDFSARIPISSSRSNREGTTHPMVLVLSGPNAGGKTVTMKTVGILALMAKAGLFVPASEAEFFDFDKIFAAIGDQQSRAEDLSTFSAHLTSLLHVLKSATRSSLVLLDEGFVGTDPAMGASLARAVLEYLAKKGTCSIITTHFSQLKTIADENPLFMNASMEFEPTKLSPTYRLLEGIPGQSYAFELAERMGYEAEILAQARKLYGQDAGRLEALLKELQIARHKAEEEKKAAEILRAEAEAFKGLVESEYNMLQSMKQELAATYESQLTKRLNAFRNALEIKERQFEKQKQRLFNELVERQATQGADEENNQPISLKIKQQDGAKGIALKHFAELGKFAQTVSKQKQESTVQKKSNEKKGTASEEKTSTRPLTSQELLELAQQEEIELRLEFQSIRQSFADDVDSWFKNSGTAKRMRQFSETRDALETASRKQQQKHSAADFTVGIQVLSNKFKGKGEVSERANAKGLVACQFGSIKTKLHFSELEIAGGLNERAPVARPGTGAQASSMKQSEGAARLDMLLPPQVVFPSRTIDLRGCEADVAIDKLELFLDKVFREDMNSFVILHGHGTGAVKAAVRNWLKTFQTPCRYRPGTHGEGGDGVTVVVFES